MGVVLVAALATSFVWWWIDKVVEGDNLVELSRRHSLTAGDLLAVPQLFTAGIVLLAAGTGLARRLRAKRNRAAALPEEIHPEERRPEETLPA